MVSQGLVRFFPSLVFPSFSVLFSSSSSSSLFFFHIYHSLSIILCFSIDSMQLWDYKSVLHSICRFPCLLWFTYFTSFPLHFSTIFFASIVFLVIFIRWFFFLFNFHRSSCVLCLVHAFFYMFLQFSTVYIHFLHLLEWNRAKLHSKTQWSFMLCVWLFESAFLTVLMPFHRLVCALECPKMFIFIYAWF